MAITEPYATTTQLNMQNRSIYLGFALFPSFHVRNVVQQKQTVFYPTFPCRWFEPFFLSHWPLLNKKYEIVSLTKSSTLPTLISKKKKVYDSMVVGVSFFVLSTRIALSK